MQTEYQYNAGNQLIQVSKHSAHKKEDYYYQYDTLGRRISKTTPETEILFFYNGDVLLNEQTKSENQEPHSKTYLFEPDNFRLVALIQGKEIYHYHLDHLGTPQELTHHNGELAWSVHYRAYGNVVKKVVQSVENNLRFQGQYHDHETGLHYNRHRYYDPHTARFINQDPIGLLGGNNNYQYVPNPIAWVDPFGLACEEGDAAKRRIQSPLDITLPSEKAARREAIRRHGGQISAPNSFKRVDNWDKNPNLRGPIGQPSEFLDINDLKGNGVRIDHHKWGHEFKDNNTFEYPHYQGPKGEHISYPPGG